MVYFHFAYLQLQRFVQSFESWFTERTKRSEELLYERHPDPDRTTAEC